MQFVLKNVVVVLHNLKSILIYEDNFSVILILN